MMFKKFSMVVAAAALMGVSAMANAAGVTIDSFSAGGGDITSSGSAVSNNEVGPLAGVFGNGSRVTTADHTAGPGSVSAKVNTDISGAASLNSDAGTSGQWKFEYASSTAAGEDITVGGNNAFGVEFLNADFGAQLKITVTESLAAGGSTASHTVGIPAGPSVVLVAFSNYLGIDFTAITNIAIEVLGQINGDYTINLLETATIPTPAALPAGLALVGALALRRSRKA